MSACYSVGTVHDILCEVPLLLLNPPNNPPMQTVLLSLIPRMSEGTCLGSHGALCGEPGSLIHVLEIQL